MSEKDAAALLAGAIDVAKPVVETGCRLIEDLLGEPFEVAGGMLADQVYAWRWTNRIRIAAKAQRKLAEDGLTAKVLPAGFLMPLLEDAGNIEDPDLQELWANLLASGVHSESNCHPGFANILKQLKREEGLLLDLIAKRMFRFDETFDVDPVTRQLVRRLIPHDQFPLNRLGCSEGEMRSYLTHLYGLTLIVPSVDIDIVWETHKGMQRKVGERHFTTADPTPFGLQFLSACCATEGSSPRIRDPWQLTAEALNNANAAIETSSDVANSVADLETSVDEAKEAAEEAKQTADDTQESTGRFQKELDDRLRFK